MFSKKQKDLNRASQLIQQQKYTQARTILWKYQDDPTAHDWLTKVDAILAQQKSQKTDPINKVFLYCGGIVAFVCACCMGFTALGMILPDSTSGTTEDTSDSPSIKGQAYIAGDLGSVNIRSGPATTNAIIGSLLTGTRITIWGESNGWYEIQYKGGSGWVSKSLTSLTRPQPQQNLANGQNDTNNNGNAGSNAGGGETNTNPPAVVVTEPAAAPAAPAAPAQFTCPSNCAGARAMGLSPQQAASCGLDRDHDGVACYGD